MATIFNTSGASSLAILKTFLDFWFTKAAVLPDIVYAVNTTVSSGLIIANNITIQAGVTLSIGKDTKIFCAGNFLNDGSIVSLCNSRTGDIYNAATDAKYLNVVKYAPYHTLAEFPIANGGAASRNGGGSNYGRGGAGNSGGTPGRGWNDVANPPHWWAYAYLLNGAGSIMGIPQVAPTLPPCNLLFETGGIDFNTGAQVEIPAFSIEIFCRGNFTNTGTISVSSPNPDSNQGGAAGANLGILCFGSGIHSGALTAVGGSGNGSLMGSGGGGGIWILSKDPQYSGTADASGGSGGANVGGVGLSRMDNNEYIYPLYD